LDAVLVSSGYFVLNWRLTALKSSKSDHNINIIFNVFWKFKCWKKSKFTRHDSTPTPTASKKNKTHLFFHIKPFDLSNIPKFARHPKTFFSVSKLLTSIDKNWVFNRRQRRYKKMFVVRSLDIDDCRTRNCVALGM